jgi:replicative DNA helicase
MTPLPHNIDCEAALLGALLISNNTLDRIECEPEHFYDPVHGAIFDAIRTTSSAGRKADPITLRPLFESAQPINGQMTIPQYLGRLAANATSVVNAPAYADQVRDLYQRREMIRTASELIERASGEETITEIVADAEASLHTMAISRRNERDVISIGDAMQEAIEQANSARQRGNGLLGLSTGLPRLDTALGGLAPGNLLILAGRPGMGKTALALNIASNVARGLDTSTGEIGEPNAVGVFSLEMGSTELAMRVASEATELSSSAIRAGRISETDMHRFMRTGDDFRKVPLWIDRSGGLTIGQLSARARKMHRQRKVGLIVIDYLQLMGGNANRGGNRVQEVTDITTGLKALAKELDIPIIALSQLSRKVEDRADKRPQLADLRESGSIEQDADVVMFVYREEYYVANAKPEPNNYQATQDWKDAMLQCAGKAEVIIGKSRHGPIGIVNMTFDGKTTTFRDGAAS